MIVRVPANPHFRDLKQERTTMAVKTSVKKKMNLRSFKLNRVYLDSLKMSNAGDFPGVEFLRILFSFKNRKENSSSYCSRNRTMDVKEMN